MSLGEADADEQIAGRKPKTALKNFRKTILEN
jgi:hypothetical protein